VSLAVVIGFVPAIAWGESDQGWSVALLYRREPDS
jgi:hypothetical protein